MSSGQTQCNYWLCCRCDEKNDRTGGQECCKGCGRQRVDTNVKIRILERSVSGWTCKNCNYDNEDWIKCKTCDVRYNPCDTLTGHWICHKCQCRNKNCNPICYKCFTEKLQVQDTDGSPTGNSSNQAEICIDFKKCTCTVKYKDESCKNCNQTSREPQSSVPLETCETLYQKPSGGTSECDAIPSLNVIGCKTCTYLNRMENKECEMCQTRLELVEQGSMRTSWTKLKDEPLKAQFSSSMIETSFRQHEKEARKILKNIKRFCDERNCKYEDNEFSNELGIGMTTCIDAANVIWKRSSDMHLDHNSDDLFFNPSGADIKQGSLMDCWFLCALTVISEREDLLNKIVLSKEISDHGVYQIRLCKDGRWKTVIVDDWFPCDVNGRLVFSQVESKNQLWVPLVEKAAAKLHGCYAALETGPILEAMAMLTGQPCEKYDIEKRPGGDTYDFDEIWQDLEFAQRQKYLMGASTSSDEKRKDDYEQVGLLLKHAYSVIDVQTVENDIRLLKLRDPWGDQTWNGGWSAMSQNWTEVSETTRSNLCLTGNDSGTFWMCLIDFCKYFTQIGICKARESGWHEIRLKGSFPRNTDTTWKFVTLIVNDDEVDIDIGLFQQNLRGECSPSQSEPLLDLLLVVLENSEECQRPFKKVLKTTCREAKSFVGCHVRLGKGKYTVASMSFKKWDTASPRDREQITDDINKRKYALAIHSSKTIYSCEVNTRNEIYRYALADIIITLVLQEGNQIQKEEVCVYYLKSFEWYGAFVVAENTSESRQAKIRLEIPNSYVVTTRNMSPDGLYVTDVVPPRHRQVLLVLTLQDVQIWEIGDLTVNVSMLDDDGSRDGTHYPEISALALGLHKPRKIPS